MNKLRHYQLTAEESSIAIGSLPEVGKVALSVTKADNDILLSNDQALIFGLQLIDVALGNG